MVRAVSLAGCFQPGAPLSLAAEKQLLLRHCLFDGNKYKPFDRVCQRVVSRGNGKISCVKQKETSERMSLFFWCGDFAARKPRPPAAALDMAPTPGQKRRRQKPSPFLLVNSQVKNPPIYGPPLSGGPSIASSWSPSGILKSSSASSPKKPFQPPNIIKASSTTISSWPSISSRW